MENQPEILLISCVTYVARHRETGRTCKVDVDMLNTFPELVKKWDDDGWTVYTHASPYDAPVHGILVNDDVNLIIYDADDYQNISELKLKLQSMTNDRDNWRAAATVNSERARD